MITIRVLCVSFRGSSVGTAKKHDPRNTRNNTKNEKPPAEFFRVPLEPASKVF